MNPIEAISNELTLDLIKKAQSNSWEALHEIARSVRSGMTEADIVSIAGNVLKRAGSSRAWRRSVVRVGANTIYGFLENQI